MRVRGYVLVVIILLFILSVFLFTQYASSIYPTYQLTLVAGENEVIFSEPLLVRDLVRAYPVLETVSYFDEVRNTTVGYVNVHGGIGKNFLIIPGETYEVVSRENVTIYL